MRKIKDIFYSVLVAVLLTFSLTSCLDQFPTEAFPEEESMLTLSDAEQTLTGIYSLFKSSALYGGYLTLCPDIQSDLAYAVTGNSNTYGNIWQWDILSTSSEIEAVYGALYKVIGFCNFYLEKVDALRATLVIDEEIEHLDIYTGEVYCARALAYSELLKLYCKAYDPATAENELGVVLVTKWTEPEEAVRASLKESYEFVVSDLEKAQELLDSDYDMYSSYYLTKAAAQALRARVALYMQDWDNAIKYSSEIIDSEAKMFQLADARSQYTSDMTYLDYMWAYDVAYEIIWRVGYTPTSYGGALGQVFLNFTSDYTYYYPDYIPAQWVLNLYDSSDGRLGAYFATLQTGYSSGLSLTLLTKYYGNQTLIGSNLYHLSMPKVFRLSEQYLIRAEAYCMKGDYSKASADLTTLRNSRCTTNGTVAISADNYLEVISNERVKELYMEGFRLHDLKRWNMGFERTLQTGAQPEGSSLKVNKDNALFVWPIPKHEIEAPGSQIQPNDSNK